jgi:signal transduction histidine kinase
MESMAGAKGLDLTADLPLSLPTLKGDWNSLFRVLTNLIDNAIKFSDKGQIVVSAEEKSGEIEIVVRDEGQGIQPEHLEMIFERFFQEKNRFPGVGVGLTICQAVVTAHDGRIWAESPGRGQGATFRFTLPVVHP